SALDVGLRLLGRRAHSRAELGRKLGRRGYPEIEVRSAVDRLMELGYLDDRAFAEGHVRRRQAGLGPLALSAELSARGVDRQVADGALARFDGEAQLASATRLAERLYGRKPHAGYREMLDAIGPKLLRRGFSSGVARAACRAVWDGTSRATEA
ncbi:MAG: regulatory protein RecX, partial [Candidatus Dormiibacterota bacterium]